MTNRQRRLALTTGAEPSTHVGSLHGWLAARLAALWRSRLRAPIELVDAEQLLDRS